MTNKDDATSVAAGASSNDSDLRAFFVVLRQALLMVVAWIERRYELRPRACPHCGKRVA